MELRLNAEIECADGAGGRATALILNPVTRVATHLVIDPKGHGREAYLLPLEWVTETSVKHIVVRCNQADLHQLPPLMQMVRVEGTGLDAMNAQALMGSESQSGVSFQDFSFAGAGGSELVEAEALPEAEIAVRHGIVVEAVDGKAGEVEGFVVDRQSGQITHLVLREGRLFGKKDVAIPVDEIDRIGETAVFLATVKATAK